MSAIPPKKRKRKEINPLPWVILVVGVICAAVWLVARNSDNVMQPVAVNDTTTIMLAPPPPPTPTPPPPPQVETPPQDEEDEMIEQAPVDENEPSPDEMANEPPTDIDLGPGSAGGTGPAIGGGGGGGNRIGSGRGRGSKFGWYAARVQTSIREALGRNLTTRSATLSLQIRIWVDANGRVTRTQLVGTSGNPAVDQAIKNQVLNGMVLPQAPPADLPMPINIRITGRKPING